MKKTISIVLISALLFLAVSFYPQHVGAEKNIDELFSQKERIEKINYAVVNLYDLAGKRGRNDIQQALVALSEKSQSMYFSIKERIGEYVKKNIKEDPEDVYLGFKKSLEEVRKYEDLKRNIFKYGSKSVIDEFEETKEDIYENFELFLLLKDQSPKKEDIKNIEKEINDDEALLYIRTENPSYLGEIKMVFEKDGWKIVEESWLVLLDANVKNNLMQIRSFAESLYAFDLNYSEFRKASSEIGEKKYSLGIIIDEIVAMNDKEVHIYFSENDENYCMYTQLVQNNEEFFCIDSSGQMMTGSKGEVKCSRSNIFCK